MKTSLNDLNKYLFEELERLNDDEQLSADEDFEKEIKRLLIDYWDMKDRTYPTLFDMEGNNESN